MAAPPPPPRRTAAPSAAPSTPATPEASTWSSRMKAKGSVWGKKAIDKSVVLSDNIGGRVNNIAEKRFGTEHFWPVTGDFVNEMEKCARILRAFTVEGVVKEVSVDDKDEKDMKKKKKAKVLRKIPPAVMKQAKGVAIFTSMRSGFAPLGGAGGSGLVMAKLPDGTWSAPSSISPNNLSTGFLIGLDVYDCVLVINSQSALDSFSTHKATLGAEIGVAAGPYGAGAAVEAGLETAPVFSYVKSRGLYAGVELVGQVFFERFEENAAMYHWPGVKAGDILAGRVRVPVEAANLHAALRDAETGRAQVENGKALDIIVDSNAPSASASQVDLMQLNEGEVMKLPPLPSQTDGTEQDTDPETSHISHTDHPSSGYSAEKPSAPPVPGRGSSGPLLPPRPVMSKQFSSQSYYSIDDGAAEQMPPVYVAEGKEAETQKLSASGMDPSRSTAGMTDAERQEWEEHWRQEDEELARALETTKLDQHGPEAGLMPPPAVASATSQTGIDEKESLR